MNTRLKRLLVFAIPAILAIALISGLSAGMEDTDNEIDGGDHGEFIDIDGGDHGEFIDIDGGDHGEFIDIDGRRW